MKNFMIKALCYVIVAVSGWGLHAQESNRQSKGEDAVFWKSVYDGTHVVKIDISLTKEAWEAMAPKA